MLTGKVPVEEVVQGKYEPIIRKCIEMEPARRYQRIEEILDELNPNIKIEEKAQIAESSKEKWIRILKEWAIPGFRTMNVGNMIVAGIVYFVILYLCVSLEVTNEEGALVSMTEVWVYRICLCIGLFLCVFYSFNYRGIADKIYFIPQRTKWAHVIESIVICAGTVVAMVFAIALCLVVLGL